VAPLIAFVTAYDEYAIRAFELNVIDYLLKPVDSGRLRQTIERAYVQIGMTGYQPVSSLPNLRSAAENFRQESFNQNQGRHKACPYGCKECGWVG